MQDSKNFEFNIKNLRTLTSPSNTNITTYYMFADFKDLPENIPSSVNPRKTDMNTVYARQLIEAVYNDNINFELNNRGITIHVQSLKYNPAKNTVSLDFGLNKDKYGILDGSTTYKAIIENRYKMAPHLEKYVRLEIITGEQLNSAEVTEIRSTAVQLTDLSLYELEDKFDLVKNNIQNHSYSEDIAYKDSSKGRLHITELLKLMFIFNIKRYTDDNDVPLVAFFSRARVLEDYKNEYAEENNIYKKLVDELPQLIELYEEIQTDIYKIYQQYKENQQYSLSSSYKENVDIDCKTLFTEKKLDCYFPAGYLLPIFGSFRALLKERDGQLYWDFNPIEIWKRVALQLVQNTFTTTNKPQLAGQNKNLWQSNYRIVDNIRKEILLERLTDNKKTAPKRRNFMSNQNPKWKFPSTNGGNISGLNETGITQFKALPIKSVTKETLQDSLDAKQFDTLPSIVKISVFTVPRQNIPDIDGLTVIFESGKVYWQMHEDSRIFFENGIYTLNEENITVMSIRDFNTSGLSKIDSDISIQTSGGWASLIRSTGVTEKGPEASGSFGIGKHAPFAASKVHTVLYGSKNIDGEYGFQGVSKIASFKDENNDVSQGTGYFGFAESNDFKPLLEKDQHLIAAPFHRNEVGTDKFIIGVDIDDDFDWKFEVLKEAITSFMLAINDGDLEVHIDDFILNQETLPKAIKEVEKREPQNMLIEFYKALTSDKKKVCIGKFKTPDGEEEEIELHLLAEEGFQKKIVMYRGTGMQIFTKGHFRTPIEFAGVLCVKGSQLNAILRKMEPPTHDKWDANLYKKDVKYGKRILKEIFQWLNTETKALIDLSNIESVELKEIEKLLPDISQKEGSIIELDRKKTNTLKNKIKRKKTHSPRNKEGAPGNDKPGIIKTPPEREGKPKPPLTPRTPGGTKLARIHRIIPYCINEKEGLYRVKIWPSTEGNRTFSLKSIGEDNKASEIEILDVSLEGGKKIFLTENQFGPIEFKNKELVNVTVKIKSKNKLALEVYTD